MVETLEEYAGATIDIDGTTGTGSASLFEGSANPWRDDASCESVTVYSCDPLTDPDASAGTPGGVGGTEDLCGQWDFFAGEKATTILVRASNGSDTDVQNQQAADENRTHDWVIFETGPDTKEFEGLHMLSHAHTD